MPAAVIFGGSGKVARHLTTQLVKTGYTVHSVIRRQEQAESLSELGAKPIIKSIEASSVSEIAKTIQSCSADVVIWSAGAGGGDPARTIAVDRDGAIKSFDAATEAGVKRYIIVSATDMRNRDSKPIPEWYNENDRQKSDQMWKALGPYMQAKLAADTALVTGNAKRGLNYTIVRPGTLTNDPGNGTVDAGKVHLGTPISREDVASVVMACILNEGTVGMAFDVMGGKIPVTEAVRKVVEEKADTFDGHY